MHAKLRALIFLWSRLTVYKTVSIWIFPVRAQAESFAPVERLNTADWTAPKPDMMAVLEYWYGYLFPMFDCNKNHDDHSRVPATRAMHPTVQLSAVFFSFTLPTCAVTCEAFAKVGPLYVVNSTAPEMHTTVPITFAFPLLLFNFTDSNLFKRNFVNTHLIIDHLWPIEFLTFEKTNITRKLGIWDGSFTFKLRS